MRNERAGFYAIKPVAVFMMLLSSIIYETMYYETPLHTTREIFMTVFLRFSAAGVPLVMIMSGAEGGRWKKRSLRQVLSDNLWSITVFLVFICLRIALGVIIRGIGTLFSFTTIESIISNCRSLWLFPLSHIISGICF